MTEPAGDASARTGGLLRWLPDFGRKLEARLAPAGRNQKLSSCRGGDDSPAKVDHGGAVGAVIAASKSVVILSEAAAPPHGGSSLSN